MSRIWGKIKEITPFFAVYCAYLLLPTSVKAAKLPKLIDVNLNQNKQSITQISKLQKNNVSRSGRSYSEMNNSINNRTFFLTQINTINAIEQLQDIKPTDWSYEALRNLSDRYGCIGGFDDGTYKGEKNISRAEFAAGLNSCLNKIEGIIGNSNPIPQNDINTVLKLMQEFQSDLAILQGITDGAQAKLEDLEATQFSTTSKLKGETVFGLSNILSDEDQNTILGSRLRLELETSFQGDDHLLARLSNSDFSGFSEEIGTFQGNLAFAKPEQDDFQVEVLQYTFNVGDEVDFILGATGMGADDLVGTINILDGDGSSGAISTFATRNPIYYPPRDAGLGIVHSPIEQIKISAGYLTSAANNSDPGNGLFNGPYSALGQITIAPMENLSLAATYIHSYNQSDTETGTNRANLQSRTAELLGEETSTISNSYGLELSWAISDRIVIGGWGGLSKVSNLQNIRDLNQQIDRGTQNIWNWAATLALPDLGKEGNLAGLVIGSEPTVTDSTIDINNETDEFDSFGADGQRALHMEAFYQYQVSDNIAITPGLIWITKPESDRLNVDNLVIGTIRTKFNF